LRELNFRADDFTRFSVPHALCLAGEFQHSVGQGSVVAGIDLRVAVAVEDTSEEFRLALSPASGPAEGEQAWVARWRDALGRLAVSSPDELDGLRITLGQGDPERACPMEDVLCSPAAAVALGCAVHSHRQGAAAVSAGQIASLADALLADVLRGPDAHEGRFYALAMACILGGAWCAGPGAEPLNVQLSMPPDSMILVLCPSAAARQTAEPWQRTLADALRALRMSPEKFSLVAGDDMAGFFEVATARLEEPQTVVLYGLLRMHEMVREHIEMLGRPVVDHDRLAETCDEESALLEDYFDFPGEHLQEVRDVAVESGALGAKMTYAMGERPALIVLAPGRRDEVASALSSRFKQDVVLPVNVGPDGLL